MLQDLRGFWIIARTIEPQGSLAGTATFSSRSDGCLAYAERGELHVNGRCFAAERRYLFEPRGTGFAVWFDGEPRRLFHEIVLRPEADGALSGAAMHLCGADTYRSTYRFEADSFTIVHHVFGPRKAYTMTTLYTRAAEQRAAA